MAGKVDPGSFDLVRKSAKFLQLAAANGLTLHDISIVYGEGFTRVIEADALSEDAAIKSALDTALFLKNQEAGIGGLFSQLKKQLGPKAEPELIEIKELRLDQKERIIKNGWSMDEWHQQYAIDLRTIELADIAKYFHPTAPESAELPNLVANHFQGKDLAYLDLLNAHKRKGGDPQVIKAMAGNEETLAYELRQPLESKVKEGGKVTLWSNLGFLFQLGRSERLLETIGATYRGKPLQEQLDTFNAQQVYVKWGGDKKLRELAAQWLPYYDKIQKKYQQELVAWNLDTSKPNPKDPWNVRQKNILPKSNAELDILFKANVIQKKDCLQLLREIEKKM
jgi:hypothetical protein